MSQLQSIGKLSQDQTKNVVDSIEYVFFDVDGVLVHNKTLIPGAVESVAKFRKLGKRIAFVSNNTVYSQSLIAANLKPFGATEAEIVTPNVSLLAYLKKIGFKKDIYVIGPNLPRQLLKEQGYNVIQFKDICSEELDENISEIEKVSFKTLDVCKNVGAVYVDLDYNFCHAALHASKIILNHMEEVLFLSGSKDDAFSINKDMKFIGSKYFIDGLERWTQRESLTTAKPGLLIKDVLQTKFNISDDGSVLFIGDNVYSDIAFGVNCGYKTCLALSGVTSKSEAEEWKFPENLKPTYVVSDLSELYEKIKGL